MQPISGSMPSYRGLYLCIFRGRILNRSSSTSVVSPHRAGIRLVTVCARKAVGV